MAPGHPKGTFGIRKRKFEERHGTAKKPVAPKKPVNPYGSKEQMAEEARRAEAGRRIKAERKKFRANRDTRLALPAKRKTVPTKSAAGK